MIPYRSLLQFEVGSIQRFITEGTRLRDMRGASAQIDTIDRIDLPQAVRRSAPGVDVLRNSGGVALLGVPRDAPEETELEVRRGIRRLYRAKVPGVALYDVVVEPEGGEDLQDLLARVRFAAASHENQSPVVEGEAFGMEPVGRFCQSCGRRPASSVRPFADERELVCRPCAAKAETGLRLRRGRHEGSVLGRFAEYVRDRPGWTDVLMGDALPDDFNKLADAGSTGELALLAADGNRLGATLRDIRSLEDYRSFSEKVGNAVEEAVFEALAEHPPRGGAALPWEILYLGGDDMLLAVASDIAFDVADGIMRGVERRTRAVFAELGLDDHRPCLTMAGGLAVAGPHYPFQALYTLAKELEESAKKRAYDASDDGQPEASALDFHRITSSGRTTLSAIRGGELRPRRGVPGERVRLTERPYTLTTLGEVLGVARAWSAALSARRLPRTKLHYLREQLFESPAEAMFAWAHVVGRAKQSERQAWQHLAGLYSPSSEGTYAMPWFVRTGAGTGDGADAGTDVRSTYLLDVLDAMALLPSNAK